MTRRTRVAVAPVLLALSAAILPAGGTAPAGAARGGGQVVAAWEDRARGEGGLAAFEARPPFRLRGRTLPAPLGPVLHFAAGRLYVAGRSPNTLQVIDPTRWRRLRVYPLPGGDPVDVVVAGRRAAYVTRLGAAAILRVDLGTGAAREIVDLSDYADADGIPDLGHMLIHDGRLLVQVRRFNDEPVSGYERPAYLAVVDLASEQLVDVEPLTPGTQLIELQGTPPKHRMQVIPGTSHLLVSATGGFFDAGGLEAVDLQTLRSQGLVLREADGAVGADLGPFVMTGPGRGYLVFSTDLTLSSHLLPFSLAGGAALGPELHVSVDYAVPALAHHAAAGTLAVPDGVEGRRGLFFFNAATGRRLNRAPIPTGGVPTDVLALPAAR